MYRWILLVALAAVLCNGCLSAGTNNRSQKKARLAKERAQASAFQPYLAGTPHRVTIQELDQLTYDYADRYYMMVSSAIDAIKRNNPDPAQRRRAHQLKLNGVLAMNDIVTSSDPYSRVLDLVVSVTLESRLLIDENGAERVFDERAPGLIKAIRIMRVEAWDLAAKVLTQEQLESLDYLILEWRRTHPDIEEVAYVKFDNFAGVRAAELLSNFKAGSGFLASLSEASQVLKDWARLSERAFWYSKRAPNIAGIEIEGAANEILAAPEIGSLIKDANRLGQSVGDLPQTLETERKAMFAELDARKTLLTISLADVRRILDEAEHVGKTASDLSTNLTQTLLVLGNTLKVGEDVGKGLGFGEPSTNRARPFDIQDYTAALARLNDAITNAHQFALSADQFTRSLAWKKGIRDLADAADRRLDRALLNICIAMTFAFILAVAYRAISLKLSRRMATDNSHKP